MKTHKHTNTQTHKHTNTPDSYLLNSSRNVSVTKTLKSHLHHSCSSDYLFLASALFTSHLKLKLKLKLKLIAPRMLLPVSLCALLPLNVNAALSATTVNTIQGTKPYFTFDGGLTKATDTSSLLSIKLSNGKAYTQGSNPSSASNPIMLPVSGQSINDVSMFIPKYKTIVALVDLLSDPYDYLGDDDGDADGLGEYGIHATGDLSVTITDVNNQTISRDDELSGCSGPYKVVLSVTNGELQTRYGDPRVTDFKASSATYYITPKTDTPYACFAKPNLEYDLGAQPEWDGKKGFKVQSLSDPKKNFPRTGFNGAFFDITIAGATAESVISATGNTITQGGITATLTAQSANVVRVTLTGPNHASSGGEFEPSIFTIKSGSTNDIYNFTLSKWFVAKPGESGGYSKTQDYCRNLTGGYRIPSVSEYTNANGSKWTWGLSGQGNTYARVIGNGKQKTAILGDDSKGGLFAEWGNTVNNYYILSDFERADYWAIDVYSGRNQRYVASFDGNTGYYYATSAYARAACVTP